MVDDEIVLRRLRELDLRLTALDGLARTTDEPGYLADLAVRAQVERHLQIAVQCAIDVAMHVVAEDTPHLPEDYGGAFLALAQAEILDPSLAASLRDAAGLRNVLVHGYTELDHRIVWSTLGDLDDLRRFARSIIAHLDS